MQTAVSEAEEERYAGLQQMALDFVRNGEIELHSSMLEAGMPVNLSDAKGNSLLMNESPCAPRAEARRAARGPACGGAPGPAWKGR